MSLAEYNPHPIQQQFHDAVQSHRRVALVTGRQLGKSTAGAVEAAIQTLFEQPGETGVICAPTYKHALVCRDLFNRFVPREMRSWNGQESRWQISNGSTVYLRSMTDEDSTRGLSGSWGWLDEAAMYSQKSYDNLRPAFAVADAKVWATTTPKGHNWLHREFVRSPQDGDILIQAASTASPYFPQAEYDRLAARYGEDSPWFRQEILGLFEAFVGQAFPAFDRTKHVEVCEETPWPMVAGWDVGWTAPTVIVWGQVSPDEQVVLRGCRKWTETERILILSEVARELPPMSVHWIPTDATYGARQAGDPGWQTEMRAAPCGFETRSVSTSRVSETRRLQLQRQWIHQHRLVIARGCEGAELLIDAFETAELDKKPEKDILSDMHPQTDIIDAVGQIFAGTFGAHKWSVTAH